MPIIATNMFETTAVSIMNVTTSYQSSADTTTAGFTPTSSKSSVYSTAITTAFDSNYSLVYVNGHFLASKSYTGHNVLKHNFEYEAKIELTELLEMYSLVLSAEVTVTDVKVLETSQVEIVFACVLSVQIAEVIDMEKIKLPIVNTINNANQSEYELFDETSFSSLTLSFEKPKIINIAIPSAAQIERKISK